MSTGSNTVMYGGDVDGYPYPATTARVRRPIPNLYGYDGANVMPNAAPAQPSPYQVEEHQRMLADEGLVPRGPSPGFAETHASQAAALPQFDPTGGAQGRLVQDLDAQQPLTVAGRIAAPGMRSAGGRGVGPVEESNVFKNYLGTPERPGLSVDEADKRAKAATQPSTPEQPPASPIDVPAPGMLGTAARPSLLPGEVNPATGLSAEQARANDANFQPGQIPMSQQMVRGIWQQFVARHGADYGTAANEFAAHMQDRWGVDGHQLLDQWTKQRNLLQFDFPQPGQYQTPGAKVSMNLATGQQLMGVPVSGGAEGNRPLLVTRPNGQTVMVDANGQTVGGTVYQGAPMAPVPVMGPQPGYTPVPGIDPRQDGGRHASHSHEPARAATHADGGDARAVPTGAGAQSLRLIDDRRGRGRPGNGQLARERRGDVGCAVRWIAIADTAGAAIARRAAAAQAARLGRRQADPG